VIVAHVGRIIVHRRIRRQQPIRAASEAARRTVEPRISKLDPVTTRVYTAGRNPVPTHTLPGPAILLPEALQQPGRPADINDIFYYW
jgi:hypothetical protein